MNRTLFRLARTAPLLPGLLLLCTTLQAQAIPQIASGDRVRVSSPALGGRAVGTVLSTSATTLVLRAEGSDTVHASWPDIRRLEISRGHASRGQTAMKDGGIGFLVGGATGALLGYVTYEEPSEGEWCLMACSRKDTALLAGMLLGITGGTAGGVLGAIAPPEQWERLTLPQAEISLDRSSIIVSVPLALPKRAVRVSSGAPRRADEGDAGPLPRLSPQPRWGDRVLAHGVRPFGR